MSFLTPPPTDLTPVLNAIAAQPTTFASVQRGTFIAPGTARTDTVTIAAVNTAKATANVILQNTALADAVVVLGELIDSTTLRITTNGANGATNPFHWEVIEYV